MLIYSMGVSADGFTTGRSGEFAWSVPSDEQFQHSLDEVSALGAYILGRRLYETMRVWETDPSLRDTPLHDAFADAWIALPKIVFSRTLTSVDGNARLATASLADEIANVLAETTKDVSIGGPELAAQAIELDLVDELRMIRHPVVVGGGARYLPPVERDLTLELVETRPFASRTIYERYRRVREG